MVSWKTTPCICVQDITEHYDEDYLLNYFESGKRSGGGEVVSLELFGNGEAKVMFKELKGNISTQAITIGFSVVQHLSHIYPFV